LPGEPLPRNARAMLDSTDKLTDTWACGGALRSVGGRRLWSPKPRQVAVPPEEVG
jgi:hypothetical protein